MASSPSSPPCDFRPPPLARDVEATRSPPLLASLSCDRLFALERSYCATMATPDLAKPPSTTHGASKPSSKADPILLSLFANRCVAVALELARMTVLTHL